MNFRERMVNARDRKPAFTTSTYLKQNTRQQGNFRTCMACNRPKAEHTAEELANGCKGRSDG